MTCVFCQRADQPMTREHVFARWLVQKIHGARLVPSAQANAAEPARISRIFASVCASCNAGWMSGLEVAFRRPVFGRSRIGLLQPPERITLSRWFTKTAMLLADASGVVFITSARRPQLVTGMPDDVEVFLARRRRPRQRLDYAIDVVGDAPARSVHTIAILVDDLIAHIALRDTLSSRHGTQLWPLRTHTLRWETLPVVGPLALVAR